LSGGKRLKNYIKGNFNVCHIRNSDVVKLTFTSHNPELAKFVLTELIESYLRYDVDTKIQVTNYANKQINLRLSELLTNMEKAEQNLLKYKKDNKLTDIGDIKVLKTDQIKSVSQRIIDANRELQKKENDLSAIKLAEGNIEEKGAYLKDKLHGLVLRWYTTEQLSSSAMFSSGKLQGLMRIFSPSGSTMKEGYYFEGLPVVIFEYYENGRFRRILAYRGNEIIQEKVWTAIGVEITTPVLGIRTKSNVHSNGNPSYECTYKNNIKHGIEWNWGEYFDLQSLNIYDQGSLVLERTWTAPGVPNEDIMFPGRSKQVIIGSYSSAD